VRTRFLAAIAAVIFFGGPASNAETLTETLENFGFFGRWAMDCEQPPSPTNNVRIARLSATSDPTFNENLGGSGEPNSYVIVRAKRTSPDTIVLRTKLNGEIVQELTMHRHGDRIQTITNRDPATGRYVVRKGVIVGTKQETPWLTRCAEQDTPSRNDEN
jgi:hypothetical protein